MVPCDTQFFRLSKLQWEYDHPPAGHTLAQHREYVQRQCDSFRTAGRFYIVEDVSEAVGISAATVHKWIRRNLLITVQIGATHYLSMRYAQHVIEPFTMWDTAAVFARKTELSVQTVHARLKDGGLTGRRCFDNKWRVRPTDPDLVTLALDVSGNRLLTYEEMAHRLDVPVNTIKTAAHAKRIAIVGKGATARVTESEVEKWEERFNRLNEGFEWLEPLVANQAITHSTLGPKLVFKKLGISPSGLSRWCKAGLLPFFVQSFTAGEHDVRLFVRRYINGLSRFANETPVPQATAQKYFALCKSNSRIM